MKLPVFKEGSATSGWIVSLLLAVLCLLWRNLAWPGWEYSTGIFLAGIALLLVLFSAETSRSASQMAVLVFVVGTGILLMASRFPALMNGITFGPSLLPVNGQLGILSGLLWSIPVFTSLPIASRYTENIYLRALLGGLLVTVPSIFMMLSSERQLLIFWKQEVMPVKAVLIWLIAGFFFHFAIHQRGNQPRNPLAERLYFTWLGFFVAAEILQLLA